MSKCPLRRFEAACNAHSLVNTRFLRIAWTLVFVSALAPMQVFGTDASQPTSSGLDTAQKPKPVFELRELYALGHFGNSYEVMGDDETRHMLAEAASWGFNSYADWFDMDDCKDPFTPGHTFGLGDALWYSKKNHYAISQDQGLPCSLVITPNHVYITQCLPGLLATRKSLTPGPSVVHGQVICPSIPQARAMILKDYEELFGDLARSGVRLSAINALPYDFGGCRCEKCNPWILTFAKLTREIHQIARRHYPKIKTNIIGWWWSAEEHRLFADWVDQHAPGWIDTMYLHLPYGATRVADVVMPKGCRRGAFIHIGYSDSGTADIYGHLGPMIAAYRLQETVRDLKAQGVVGFMAYSEGVHDDVNKAILAGLSSGEYQTADAVLEAYARRYFGVDAETAKLWAAWLRAWGKPFDVDTDQSAATLEMLLKKTPKDGWRRRQWELKQQLFAINKEIGAKGEWTPKRLAAVERFWSVQEQMQRGLWGLPPLRHTLGRTYTPMPWYASWANYKSIKAREVRKDLW